MATPRARRKFPYWRIAGRTKISTQFSFVGWSMTQVDITRFVPLTASDAKKPYAPGHGSVWPATETCVHVPSVPRCASRSSWVVES